MIALQRTLRLALMATFLSLSAPLVVAAEKAPAFVLPNAEGELVSLADFRGKPLVLHFWATWCPYCKKLQPGLTVMQTTYADAGLVVLGVSFREDEGAQPQQVLKRRGHSFQTLLNGDDVALMYGVRGTPTTFFIDREGLVRGVTNTSDPADPVLGEMVGMILE